MKSTLQNISKKAIELADLEFSQEQIEQQWLGNKPASDSEVKRTEQRLGIELPADYKKFLKITNGFNAPHGVEPTFEPIQNIDYLRNINSYLIEVWKQDGIADIGKKLEQSIIIAGIQEEQYFLLIPPNTSLENWTYWKFSSWQPGEIEFNDLALYLNDVCEFINDCIKK